jgi:DNA processing protein
MSDDERTAWIALASVNGLGEDTFGRLLEEFGSARGSLAAALNGDLERWIWERRRLDGRPPVYRPVVEGIHRAAEDPGTSLSEIRDRGLWTLTPLDSLFPSRLRDLDPPPVMINGRGDPLVLSRPRAVALVGTRRPTAGGRALASRIAARLVESEATVVSGLAFGIDGAGHAAAIERGGITVGVIGGGHDHPGPRAHARLREEVVATGGAVISEYHPATSARKGTFPRRNRLIAALGDATIVVEAPARSGALNTATHAQSIGRPVFVAPGRVGDWSTAGALALLRDTPARPIAGLDELIEDLGYLAIPTGMGDAVELDNREAALRMLGATEQAVARRLLEGPAGLDGLVAATGLPPAAASSAVTFLLMRGWVQAVGPAYMVAGALAR